MASTVEVCGWSNEREELSTQAEDQVKVAADGLRALVQRFGVTLFSRESSPPILVDATTAPQEIFTERREVRASTRSGSREASCLVA